MDNIDSLKYLDLKISNRQKTLVKIKENNHLCNLGNNYVHELHGSNSQLNSIVDLIINLGDNLEVNISKI